MEKVITQSVVVASSRTLLTWVRLLCRLLTLSRRRKSRLGQLFQNGSFMWSERIDGSPCPKLAAPCLVAATHFTLASPARRFPIVESRVTSGPSR